MEEISQSLPSIYSSHNSYIIPIDHNSLNLCKSIKIGKIIILCIHYMDSKFISCVVFLILLLKQCQHQVISTELANDSFLPFDRDSSYLFSIFIFINCFVIASKTYKYALFERIFYYLCLTLYESSFFTCILQPEE